MPYRWPLSYNPNCGINLTQTSITFNYTECHMKAKISRPARCTAGSYSYTDNLQEGFLTKLTNMYVVNEEMNPMILWIFSRFGYLNYLRCAGYFRDTVCCIQYFHSIHLCLLPVMWCSIKIFASGMYCLL